MKNKLRLLSVPYVIWMALFTVFPIIMVVLYAFSTAEGGVTMENFADMGTYAVVFGRSFKLAAVATVFCVLIGYPVSYMMAKEGPGFQRVAMLLIMLPMWMNMLIRTYSWMNILERNGIINNLLANFGIEPLKMIGTPGAVIFGMIYNYIPYMILPIYSVMSKIEPSLLEAAEDLGSNSWSKLRRVILPMSMPGVVSGFTMVFVPSVSTFYISQKLGGKIMLVGDAIEKQIQSLYNYNMGAALSLVLMVLILISMAVMKKFAGDEGSNLYV